MKPTKHFKRALKRNRKHLVVRRRRFAVIEKNPFLRVFAHCVINNPFPTVMGV